MIHSFKDARLENLFRQGKHQAGLPTEITESIISRLAVIHSATTVKDLTSNSLRYEKLPMTRNKYSSVRVNSKYRLFFTWNDGAHDVHLSAHNYKSLLN